MPMNVPAPPPPPALAANIYQEAQSHIKALKASFDVTWKNTRTTVEFFSLVCHQQMLRIRSLEAKTTELEKSCNDKTSLAASLEARMAEMTQAFESQLAQKQNQLEETERRATALLDLAKQGEARCAELRDYAEVNGQHYKQSVAEVANLRRLNEALKTKTNDNGHDHWQEESLSLKGSTAAIEGALKKELEARSDAVRQAAAAVAKEAAAVNTTLRKAYDASQARVAMLEEQLRVSGNIADGMKKPRHISESLVTSADRASPGSPRATPHRIVSGTYRPKPPGSTPPNSTSPAVLGGSVAGPGAMAQASFNAPSPVSRPTPLDISAGRPSASSTGEVIDLTLSPVGSPGTLESNNGDLYASARPAKRRRMEPDVHLPPFSASHSDVLRKPEEVTVFQNNRPR